MAVKKLALLAPPRPEDAPDSGITALVRQAMEPFFACTLIHEKAPAGLCPSASFAYEQDEVPSYTQRCYLAWRRASPMAGERCDAALALDGLQPWSLAVLDGLCAKRRYVWLQDLPEDYLLAEDVPFFLERYAAVAAVLCASEAVLENFVSLFPALAHKAVLLPPPLPAQRYRQLAQAPCDTQWESGTADIAAVCHLDCDNAAQTLPALAAVWKQRRPELRWHVMGEGAWRDRLVQKTVLADVCDVLEPVDAPHNLAPLLAQANAYLALEEGGDPEAERMARAMGKPVLRLPLTEEALKAVLPGRGTAVFVEWKERNHLKTILESEEERL